MNNVTTVIITSGSVLAAVLAFWAALSKIIRWIDARTNNAQEIDAIRKHHKEDMEAVNEELSIICFGVLAALKGLSEKGCDGPVHEGIDAIEKHLNKAAHES